MAQKTQESAIAPRDSQCALLRWLVANGSDDTAEVELSPDELQGPDPELAETVAGRNGRPKGKRWVLLH